MSQYEFHAMEVEDVVKVLGTNPDSGLSSTEAQNRLKKYGANILVEEKRISPIFIFLRQFTNALILILLAATVITAILGETVEAIVISVIIVFIGILGFVQEYRAEKALEKLKELTAPTCKVLRDGNIVTIPTEQVVPGDILILGEGDIVAADGRLIDSWGLKVDESALTGESVPVEKVTSKLSADVPLADRLNLVYAGTLVTSGRGKAVVIATGKSTEFGKVATYTVAVSEEKTPLEVRMNELGKKFGILAITIIVALIIIELIESLLLGGLTLEFMMEVFMFSVALAVAAVPEALPAIVTASLAIGAWTLAKHGALVRKLAAVESLGSTQVMCFDKTGTLTKGEQTVRAIYVDSKLLNVTGTGFNADGVVEDIPKNSKTFDLLLKSSILCNDASVSYSDGKWKHSGDPTEVALLFMAIKAGIDPSKVSNSYPRVAENPFTSERKMMSTINIVDGKPFSFVKGAPEVVIQRCTKILVNGEERPLDDTTRTKLLEINEQLASHGLRVLGFGYREMENPDVSASENELTFLGLVGLIDPPRPESIKAIEVAKSAGVKPVMITGDHKLTAIAVAKECGIDADYVITGQELEAMDAKELARDVEKVTVYARTTPIQKLKIVEACKARGASVAMTGDGVNDAPALKRADVGVAMGIRGTAVAKESSDLILTDDSLATLVKAIELGRWILDNIKRYLAYLLQANLVEIVVLSFTTLFLLRYLGFTGEEALALLPVHILYINLATDGLPALALGLSPPDPDLMNRPPIKRGESVFSKEVVSFLIRALIVEPPVMIFAFYSALPYGIDAARTRLFLLFVAIELVVAISCRSLRHTVFKVRPHKWLILAVFWESVLIGLLIWFPVTREALHLSLPTIEDFMWMGFGGMATFLSIELLKLVSISRYNKLSSTNPNVLK
ncbi:MAG: cation-translocating P-type ATPase [Aigarchaeota archaeon]|nr:cation-translocating P-type ATPase [Aigarchaeota archaeon]MDW7986035.1 cation-translocating P-type ATPase [Nitrososphaerota archaeon]